jgi:hypothetical protein
MKLETIARKYYLSIFFLIIFLVIIVAGFIENAHASKDADVTRLTKSIKMHEIVTTAVVP